MCKYFMVRIIALLAWISKVYSATEKGDGCSSNMPKDFDFIIVGGGTAGLTIAGRLTENPHITVLVLEAGISDYGHPISAAIETPRLWASLNPGPVTWNYTTVPQMGLKGRILPTGMGKTLGGSSSHNAMLYFRGFESDYDYWASVGATGWSYSDVFPFFFKSENNTSPSLSSSERHNKCGPLPISDNLDSKNKPLIKLFWSSAKELKIPYVECNGRNPFGICRTQTTIANGKRHSTSVVFLRPNMGRKNLFVLTESYVQKILITKYGKHAYGVKYLRRGVIKYARARLEVIVSAGTFDTPKLLQLSGIGPRSILRKAKIRPLVDLPVGLNLHDHAILLYDLYLDVPTVTREVLISPETMSNYLFRRKGLYSTSPPILSLFYDLIKDRKFNQPEVQVVCDDGDADEDDNLYQFASGKMRDASNSRRNGTTCTIFLLHPESRGWVKIRSKNPDDPPLINPRYLQEYRDVRIMISGIRKVQELLKSSPMQEVNATGAPSESDIPAECNSLIQNSDKQLECILRNQALAGYHPVGSCKMGRKTDSTSVLDPELRVKGVKGLRVADASIMPEIPSVNTMGPTIMIGEKAADLIMKAYRKRNRYTKRKMT